MMSNFDEVKITEMLSKGLTIIAMERTLLAFLGMFFMNAATCSNHRLFLDDHFRGYAFNKPGTS